MASIEDPLVQAILLVRTITTERGGGGGEEHKEAGTEKKINLCQRLV